MNSEKGQALPLVMIAVVLGALVIPPFLNHVDASLIGSKGYTDAIYSQYACDAGAEHGIWELTDGGATANLTSSGDTVNYLLPESVNNLAANVTLCKDYQAIASDDFESGGWTGGNGWLDNWTHSGEAAVTDTGGPYEGSYHLKLGSTGLVQHSLNLSHEISMHLSFCAKVDAFYGDDTATCLVSSDGVNWTTVYTWTEADSGNGYLHYDINISSYKMTSQFWISFEANTASTSDNLYIDNLKVIWLAAVPSMAASDDFENGDVNGGSGWVDNWTLTGNAEITASGGPYDGSYHLRLKASPAVAKRSVNLEGSSMANLQFWAKIETFAAGDKVTCRVSSDNITWHTVHNWTSTLSDNAYHFYSIDLSAYTLSNRFWISFSSYIISSDAAFYVDDISVQKINGYGISVKASSTKLKAVVTIDAGVSVLSWNYT